MPELASVVPVPQVGETITQRCYRDYMTRRTAKGGKAFVGTSGWNQDSWKESFYGDVPREEWLEHLASVLPAVEVASTFYQTPTAGTLKSWRSRTPASFKFAIKGHRHITHQKRLVGVSESIGKLRNALRPLGDRLAVVLWQMPSALPLDLARLESFASALATWSEVRHAIEFRHPSWFEDDVAERMREHSLAVCISDAADWPMWDEVTTDLVYVRLHGHTRTYRSSYRKSSLTKWVDRARRWLGEGRNVHIYFDNEGEGAAPKNAIQLLELLAS